MLKVVTAAGRSSSRPDPLGWQRKMGITVKLIPWLGAAPRGHVCRGHDTPAVGIFRPHDL